MAASVAPERDWTALPSPVLQLFGRHLSAPGLKHALESCKSWREPIRHGVDSFALSFPSPDADDAADDPSATGEHATQKLLHLGRAFPKLKQLHMTFFSEPDSCAGPLQTLSASLPALQELRLSFQPEQQHSATSRSLHEVLAPLDCLPALRSLQLETNMELLDRSWLQAIARLPQLQTLVLNLNFLRVATAVDIAALQPLTHLQHFELRMSYLEPPTSAFPAATISKYALEQLAARWPQLQSLSVTASAWDFGPGFAAGLKLFQGLEALSVSVDEPYEYALQPAAPAIHVRLIDIPCSVRAARLANITLLVDGRTKSMAQGAAGPDAGSCGASSCQKLEALELHNCGCDNAALARASTHYPHLRSMVVDWQPLADEALSQWQRRFLS